MFEIVEEPLNCFTLAVRPWTEGGRLDPAGHGANVQSRALYGHGAMQGRDQ